MGGFRGYISLKSFNWTGCVVKSGLQNPTIVTPSLDTVIRRIHESLENIIENNKSRKICDC